MIERQLSPLAEYIADLLIERDALRARIAALEAGIREHREHKGDTYSTTDEELWSLLDGRGE